MNNILAQVREAKESDKHLIVVTALVEADIPFIEDDLVYTLKNTRFDECKFFARTCILQTRQGKYWINAKCGHWQDLLDILEW
ncbi:MAG: hypothetical protein WC627_11970 [Legionella sp.]|jgi:hypothetical protein